MKIYVDNKPFDLGDFVSDMSARELRSLAGVPAERDLWRIADWRYSDRIKGPVTMDEKVEDRQFFGSGVGAPPRFFTAPKIINNSSPVSESGTTPAPRPMDWIRGPWRLRSMLRDPFPRTHWTVVERDGVPELVIWRQWLGSAYDIVSLAGGWGRYDRQRIEREETHV